MMVICKRLIVKGRVQGVGFRWFVHQHASKLGVFGFVRNLPSGDVECVAEGDDELVERLVAKLRKGPAFSKVRELLQESMPVSGKYKSFEISY